LGGCWAGGASAGPRALTIAEEQRPAKVRALPELVEGDGDRLTALAMAFLRSHPAISAVLVGTKNPSNLRRNVEMFETGIDEALLTRAIAIVEA